MTLKQCVHDPLILGNDQPFFKGQKESGRCELRGHRKERRDGGSDVLPGESMDRWISVSFSFCLLRDHVFLTRGTGEGSPTKIDYGKKLVPLFQPLKSGGPS